MEFSKGLPFAPKPSASKFVDPSDVDFAIKDLLKGRRIGAYQDLALGDEKFLSRSSKGSHSSGQGQAAHRAYPLQSQRDHGQAANNLRGPSVVRTQDYMLSLDVESAFFHVPIHPKHRKFFSSHLALPLFVNNKFIELQPGGYFVCTRRTRPEFGQASCR